LDRDIAVVAAKLRNEVNPDVLTVPDVSGGPVGPRPDLLILFSLDRVVFEERYT
jgi:hypothetical protein